jgi:hypothetical protein
LQKIALDGGNDFGLNPASLAVEHSHGRDFPACLRPPLEFQPMLSVHVERIAANERLIHFDRTALRASQLIPSVILERKANAMQHQPSRLLGHYNRSRDFVGRNFLPFKWGCTRTETEKSAALATVSATVS